jgi:hypothetical protein
VYAPGTPVVLQWGGVTCGHSCSRSSRSLS